VQYGRTAIKKETLNHVQRGGREFLEDTQPKALRDWRVNAIKGCVGPGTFNPFRAAVGI
jgi:hypothetical protein